MGFHEGFILAAACATIERMPPQADGRSANEVIGRAGELAAIDTLLARARSGLAGLIFDGAPGIGKSTLWRAGVESAAEAGFLVLQSRPTPAEEGLTFGGLGDIFADIRAQALRRLPGPQRRALEVALLRVSPGAHPADQRAVATAAASLLAGLSETSPLLLAIDDVQWLDSASAAVLTFAIRRLQEGRLGMLVCLRGRAPSSGTLGMDSAVPAPQLEHFPLGPMSVAGLHQLVRARLGRSFGRLEIVRIHDASGGNPFYALEIARSLIGSGATVTPGERLPVPDSLAALMRQRLALLPAATSHVLTFSAAAAEPSLANLRKAIAADPVVALQPAVAEGVVVIQNDAVKFTHPLLSETVLDAAGPTGLRDVHARLAQIVASEDGLAWHMGHAADRPDERVAAVLEAAAARARARGATIFASSLYERAGDLTPQEQAQRALERRILAAECLHVDISESVQADLILERAIKNAPAGPTRALALSMRALVRYYHGQMSVSLALADQALAEAGDDPVTRARVLVRYAFVVMQVDVDRGRSAVHDAIALLEPLGDAADPDLVAYALLLGATADMGVVQGPDPEAVVRGRRLITANRRSLERESADGVDFGLARHQDDLDRAIAMTVLAIQEKSGPGGDDPFNLVQLSGLQLLRGNWDEARRLAEAAQEAYSREGAEMLPEWALRGVAMVAAHQGRVEEARRLAAEGLELATRSGNLVIAAMHQQILGFTSLSLGDFRGADRWLTEAAATAARTGTRHPGRFKLDGDRVEAALALGEIDRARQIVEALEEAGRNSPTPWTLAIGARSRGELEAARGDIDAAAETLRGAVVEHEKLPMPFERARTLLVLGRLLRRRKERRDARATLRAALAEFERLGAPLWAESTRAELDRVPVRRASTQLTPTEEKIALLAASGLTNREVADRAFVSPKTVEANLARVYDKLGLHSRAELGRAMVERETTVKT